MLIQIWYIGLFNQCHCSIFKQILRIKSYYTSSTYTLQFSSPCLGNITR